MTAFSEDLAFLEFLQAYREKRRLYRRIWGAYIGV
jgi:hypothetical protein